MEDDWKKWKSQFWPAAVKHYFGTVLASDTTSSFAPSFRLILSDGSSGEARLLRKHEDLVLWLSLRHLKRVFWLIGNCEI
jgi:hypothetical protein